MMKLASFALIAACAILTTASGICSEAMYPSADARKPSPGNTTYYIDPADGNDANSGLTEKLAWRTFDRVNQLLFAAGDSVKVVSPGSFHRTLALMGTGTAESPVEISFAPGRYDFYPDNALRRKYQISNTNGDPDNGKALGILLDGAQHFNVSGPGATIVYRGKMIEVCIDGCEDISIADLHFDYQRPTVSEFKVVAVGDGYVDLKIHKDSAYTIENGQITWKGEGWTETTGLAQELDLKTNEVWRRRDPLSGLKLEEIGPRLVRAHGKPNTHGKPNMRPGRIYQIRNTFRDYAAVFTRRSKNVTWKNVHFQFLHGMGLVNQFSENLTFDNVVIAPAEKSGRTTAAWADCIQASGCKGKILVKDCLFSGAHDDAINIHGTYLRVVERISDKQLKVRFMHKQTFGFMAFNPGDEIEFVASDALSSYGPNRVNDARMLDPKEILLTLEKPISSELKESDVVENVTWTPEVEIRGCEVRRIPTRGFLITTRRKVLVEDNDFFKTHMSAILLGADARSWYESGCVRDMTIRGNRFIRCAEPVINIHPENRVPNDSAHQNVRIEDNDFVLRGGLTVRAKSTKGLTVIGNRIYSDQKIDDESTVKTSDCADVSVENNRYLPLSAWNVKAASDRISPKSFVNPPLEARPGAYWCWLNGNVDRQRITREMEEGKALGMRGFEIWDIGALIDPEHIIPAGPAFLGEESLKTVKHAMAEAKRLGLELNMIAASSWNAGGAWVEKSDGSKRLASSSVHVTGPKKFDEMLPLPCDDQTYYHDISVLAVPGSKDKSLASLDQSIDLSSKMDDKGRLAWNVPAGDWTILRFVCRGTNEGLRVPSPNSKGLLIDHLSAGATERHMLHMINKLGEIDPGHKILKIMSHDSYEVRPANDWTEDFVDEFKKRRHYDPGKYLPLLEGWTLADKDIQTRFIADYRKTVGELMVERHFRVSRQVLNRHGMRLAAEAGHGGYPRVDPIWAMGEVDIPRGEFWNGKQHWVTKEAACASHLYGRRYVDSESFTGWRNWQDGPAHYKQLFDVAICDGLNRVTFHTFAHNPPEAGLPGYAYHAGEHFNANNTWWKQSGPMLRYMARCCHLMQQGDFVADVCFYYGDQAPNLVPPRRLDPNIEPIYPPGKCLHCGRDLPVDFKTLGSGYGYDYIDANSIVRRMQFDPKTGQLVVGKMRYKLMVLPDCDHICMDVLQKVRELVEQGATIVGSTRPVRTNSLTGYPEADRQVEQTTGRFWPVTDTEKNTTGRAFGNGKVYTNMTSRQVLAKMGVRQDFTVLEGGTQEGPLRIDSIHRRTDNADVYFVCNSAKETKTLVCRFRDANGRAETWCPVTGEIFAADVIRRNDDGSCDIAIQLPAYGSVFVVFRRDGQAPEEAAESSPSESDEKIPLTGKWTVKFQPHRGAPPSAQFDALMDWTTSDIDGIKYFSGTATYSLRFDMAGDAAEDFWLDLGEVCVVADVSIDGQGLGTAWTYPFHVRVPAGMLTKGSHTLELKVTNVWNNRLVGDAGLDEEDRITRTNIRRKFNKNKPLVPSGLLGPVTLQPVK